MVKYFIGDITKHFERELLISSPSEYIADFETLEQARGQIAILEFNGALTAYTAIFKYNTVTREILEKVYR